MVPVLVRSSTNKEKDEPDIHEPDKQASSSPVHASTVAHPISKTKKFFSLFSSAKAVDDDLKYYNLPNRANSMEDLQDLSPVCTNPHSSRLKRFSSDMELPMPAIEHRYERRGSVVVKPKNRAAIHQPRLKKKTVSTLFSNQGSSIYLDCSKLNSRRESQVCVEHKHNHGGSASRRASVVTLGECYAQYNSESSLNCYYDQLPSVYHEETGSTELVITAQHYDESLAIKDNDDLDYGHISFIGMFAMLYCWCFPITGIFSIIYSKLAKKHYNERNMVQAKKYLSRSQLFLVITCIGGFSLIVLGFALLDFFYFREDRFTF